MTDRLIKSGPEPGFKLKKKKLLAIHSLTCYEHRFPVDDDVYHILLH